MKTRIITIVTVLFAVVFTPDSIKSQDAHLSQYDAAPMILNPSFTGLFTDAEYRISSQFRNQWGAIATKYTTSSLGYEMPIKQRFGVGGYLLNDDGAKVYNAFNFILSGAYLISTPGYNESKMSVGMNIGFIYKSTKVDRLIFDNQWEDGNFDPDLPSGEVFEKNGLIMPEVSIGFNYASTNDEKDVNPYGGLALYHCTFPKESFLGTQESRLPMRFVLHGGAKIKTSEQLTVDPKFLIMRQRNAMEITPGARFNYELPQNNIIVMGGIHYRVKDAFIFEAGLEYRNFIYKMSYDFNSSALKQFTNGKGGLEFSLIFKGRKAAGSRLI